MNKLFKSISLITLTLILTLGLFGCGKKSISNVNSNINQNQNVNVATLTVATSTAEIDMSNWKTYRNEEYGFEFKYPEDNNFKILNKNSFLIENEINCLNFQNQKKCENFRINLYNFKQDLKLLIDSEEEIINESIFNYKFEKISDSKFCLFNYSDAINIYQHSKCFLILRESNFSVELQGFEKNNFENLQIFNSIIGSLLLR